MNWNGLGETEQKCLQSPFERFWGLVHHFDSRAPFVLIWNCIIKLVPLYNIMMTYYKNNIVSGRLLVVIVAP